MESDNIRFPCASLGYRLGKARAQNLAAVEIESPDATAVRAHSQYFFLFSYERPLFAEVRRHSLMAV